MTLPYSTKQTLPQAASLKKLMLDAGFILFVPFTYLVFSPLMEKNCPCSKCHMQSLVPNFAVYVMMNVLPELEFALNVMLECAAHFSMPHGKVTFLVCLCEE